MEALGTTVVLNIKLVKGGKKKNPSPAQIALCFLIHSFHTQCGVLSWLMFSRRAAGVFCGAVRVLN